jgi:Holliday junction DNA helicase RuvA
MGWLATHLDKEALGHEDGPQGKGQPMIGRLAGRVVHEEATGSLILDVAGVGYELSCPLGTVSRAQTEDTANGKATILHVHTNLRQDALELFGFCSAQERAAFRQLTSVPNVGPRLALSVLNVLPAHELSEVIDAEDKARLSKVPGVGKKTAERLVLELRGKLPRSGRGSETTSEERNAAGGPLASQLVTALTGLGYRAAEAEKAAAHLVKPGVPSDLSSLLREALRFLAS